MTAIFSRFGSPRASPLIPSAGKPNITSTISRRGAKTVRETLALSGDARVFEANVRFDLVTEHGEALASGFTTAQSAGPDFGRFATDVPVRTGRSQHAILRLFQPDVRGTGEPQFLVLVPLRLQP